MKKLLLLAVVLIGPLAVFAQQTASDFKPAQKVELGIGAINSNNPLLGAYYDTYLNVDPYYRTSASVTGAINARYRYQFKHWVEFGAIVSYASYTQRFKDRITDVNVGGHYVSTVNIMANVRFNYLSTPTVRLYGALSLGISLNYANGSLYNQSYHKYECRFAGQFTPFGIEVGRKWYGFAELPCIGSIGYVVAGVGVRF